MIEDKPGDTDSRPETGEDREEVRHVTGGEAAPVVMFGYLPGFTAGVQAGYREGRRDLEREKSEASSAGFRRGLQAAEAFPLQPRRPDPWLLFWGALIGMGIGAVLERRKHEKIEEVGADELPDVRD